MKTPYQAHLFICTNDRGEGGKRPSCARRGSNELRSAVKAACKGMPGVRVNASGCLDRCEQGIVAALYPSGEWFEGLTESDVETLVAAVKKASES
jgi:(2Fe-2S) ferredoxin